MKRLALLFGCVAVMLTLAACQEPLDGLFGPPPVLPPHVAGAWKAQDSPWKIVLASDGTVSSFILPMGNVLVKPNSTTKVEMLDGSFSTFTAGDGIVEYDPDTRELFVDIQMERIHVVFMDNVIDGNSVNVFAGPVSEDGKNWYADFTEIFDYGPRFPQDPNEIFAVPLTFEKVKE